MISPSAHGWSVQWNRKVPGATPTNTLPAAWIGAVDRQDAGSSGQIHHTVFEVDRDAAPPSNRVTQAPPSRSIVSVEISVGVE